MFKKALEGYFQHEHLDWFKDLLGGCVRCLSPETLEKFAVETLALVPKKIKRTFSAQGRKGETEKYVTWLKDIKDKSSRFIVDEYLNSLLLRIADFNYTSEEQVEFENNLEKEQESDDSASV